MYEAEMASLEVTMAAGTGVVAKIGGSKELLMCGTNLTLTYLHLIMTTDAQIKLYYY